MKLVKEFKTPLYGIPFVVCATRDAAKKRLGEDYFINGAAACAGRFTIDGIEHVFLVYDSIEEHCCSVVTHEAVHAAWDILEIVGVKVSPSNQEPLAYLAGWCAKVTNNFMLKIIEANNGLA